MGRKARLQMETNANRKATILIMVLSIAIMKMIKKYTKDPKK